MPVFSISTNVSKDKIPTDFFKTATEKMAATLSAPSKLCCVRVQCDESMTWDGTDAPCAVVTMGCIGFKKSTHEMTQDLGPFICKTFGIPEDRYYIVYTDLTLDNVGHKHMSFRKLLDSQK